MLTLIIFFFFCSIRVTFCFISNSTALVASQYVKDQLHRREIYNIDDRLAIIILQSSLHEFESSETIENTQLFKCIRLLSRNVADTTPLITYVFTRSTSTQVKENFKTKLTDVFPSVNLMLMHIEDSDWALPDGRASNKTLWVYDVFSKDYRLMGTWRLTFPFMFSKFVGHKYFLFLDSDSYFLKKVKYNFISKMNKANRKLGFVRLKRDDREVTKGKFY